jgi:hypothetical protein
MKAKILFNIWFTLGLGVAAAVAGPAREPKARVGVYDSRAVAYALFWSEAATEKRKALIEQARAAKTAGDEARYRTLDQALRDLQSRGQLEVFSAAPADAAVAVLRNDLRALQMDLGLARIVSKWDEVALQSIPPAGRVDLTDRLVRELLPNPTEKQQKVLASLRISRPLPLEKAKQLAAAGKL